MREIHQTVVKVLVVTSHGREITVINPDIGGLLDRDCITISCFDFGNLHVSNDDVLLSVDRKTNTGKGFRVRISSV